MAEILADDSSTDDRRRVVNAGIRRGRDAAIADMRAVAEVGTADNTTSTVLATRGERLTLNRIHSWALQTELLNVVELNADEPTIASVVVFDIEDIDAAFEELDARYLAGEAAACSRTWSVIASSYAAFNRHEVPAADWVTIDHRQSTPFEPSNMTPSIRTIWDLTPNLSIHIEAVHRLNNFGAVITHEGHGTSQEGFDAEWRAVDILMVDGDSIIRCEVFDEEELDTALARFDELSPPTPRLENTASQVIERFLVHFAAREWDPMPQILGGNFSYDDRRRLVSSGVRFGGDAHLADMRASADLWTADVTPAVAATRGERLVLAHLRFPGRDQGPEAFVTDVLGIVEINADERMVAFVSFELDDFHDAIAELDARYLAGEAAAYALTWSRVADAFAAINRHELPELTPDWVNVDHRRGAAFAAGEMTAYIHDLFDDVPDIYVYAKVVHRLDNLGAVITQAGHGTSREGFQAEWREIGIFTVDGDLLSHYELFDETDIDAALVRFEELSRPPLFENAATRTWGRQAEAFNRRDIDSFFALMTADGRFDDRRKGLRVVTEGPARRKAVQAVFEEAPSSWRMRAEPIAIRGSRLELTRECYLDTDEPDRPVTVEFLHVMEVSPSGLAQDIVSFDPNDIDAAFEELDARYLAGEAAANPHTWSLTAQAYAAFNRHQLYPTAPDWVNIDHRRGIGFAPGDMIPYLQAAWNVMPDNKARIEAVHRLSSFGAVITATGHGTSQEGFDAEWRYIHLLTFKGNLISRGEFFDEADLDAALARFEELHAQTRRLENAASQTYGRFRSYFAARDWAAMAELLTVDTTVDDHRRVVNAEIRRGRDVEIANMRAFAEIGATTSTATVIATRGERLALCRTCISGEDQQPGAFHIEFLSVVEIDSDARITARSAYDLDKIGPAFEELDARYIAGEATAHAHTWSVIAGAYAAFNQHEVPATTPDSVAIDHRPLLTTEAVDLAAAIRAVWDLTPNAGIYIEAVHRLGDLGGVVTHVLKGTSPEGFNAEWRMVDIFMVEGGLLSRCEVFDEADIDTALARFEELHPQAPRLENAASQVHTRLKGCCAAREWGAMAELLADDIAIDDRRRAVNSGIQYGRDAAIADMRGAIDLGLTNISLTVIAIRGVRLELCRMCVSGEDRPDAFRIEFLSVVEINADEQIVARVGFDLDDIDAAFKELDARYLTGEGAPHARTWSVIAGEPARFSRHELPAATSDPVYIDRRKLVSIEGVDLAASVRAVWDLTSGASIHIEAVHRLTELGAVFTYVLKMTSHEGFDGEVSMIMVFTVDGDLISRVEVFDETDLDVALARFEELHPQTGRLENAASQVEQRFLTYFATRNWAALAEILTDETFIDDRRPVVNAGLWDGRDAVITNLQALADAAANITSVIATRGERLALTRIRSSNRDPRQGDFGVEMLNIVEIDSDERIVAHVEFDPNDIDAAFEELDARYVAGEAPAHVQTWSVIARTYAAFNHHELPLTTPDSVYIDHRPLVANDASDLTANIRAAWELMDVSIYIAESVHRLNELGAVVTQTLKGTSTEGLDVEYRMIDIFTVEGDLLTRCEVFDEANLDAALARFEELHHQALRLKNAASQVEQRFLTYFAARDWDAYAQILSDDVCMDDRRHVVNAGVRYGRDAEIASQRAIADVGVTHFTSTVIAIRGRRLTLGCYSVFDGWSGSKVLCVSEINAENQIVARVAFDSDDLVAAFTELDARYLSGEAATHSRTWSLIAQAYSMLNRRELPPAKADWVNVDHRRGIAFAPGDMTAYIRAGMDLAPDTRIYIETVHRLNSLGAVITQVLTGTSHDGFDAEWREIGILMFEGDLFSRSELYDEKDVDAALARFDELQPRAPRLENAASQVDDRFWGYYTAREWDAMAELLADDVSSDDRRRIVNAGVLRGRDIHLESMRALAELEANMTSAVIATRGERLALTHLNRDLSHEEFGSELLYFINIDADRRIAAGVFFDLDNIDAAFEELDARYLAGEAGAYAHTWSVIVRFNAAFNRHEIPATDWVTIDHRRLITADTSDQSALIREVWNITPDLNIRIEAVHRLNSLGAVITRELHGTSREGFGAEWRMIQVLTVEGDRIKRSELFDETDLDAAVARFEELQSQTPRRDAPL
jgi:hypothetical protein